jgi:hypothetical protein
MIQTSSMTQLYQQVSPYHNSCPKEEYRKAIKGGC